MVRFNFLKERQKTTRAVVDTPRFSNIFEERVVNRKTKTNFKTNFLERQADIVNKKTMREVVDTHHLDDETNIDVNPLIQMVEEILRHASINVVIDKDSTSALAHDDMVKLEAKSRQTNIVLMLNGFSHAINKLACKMSFEELSTGVNEYKSVISLFQMVRNYQWDTKMALILAAFALNYGEFRLLAKIYSSKQLKKPLKPRLDALSRLFHSVLELTKCIVQFKKLPSRYVSSEEPAISIAVNEFPMAVYWNARGIIALAAQITCLTCMGYGHGISSTEQSWELSYFVKKINHQLEFLMDQLEECHHLIKEKMKMDLIYSFNELFDKIHIDNMKILNVLLNSMDDPLPLFDGASKKMMSLEVLGKKNVMLLISGLDMSCDEVSLLEKIYSESHIQGSRMDAFYEVVWVPIVDPYTDAMHKKFEDMKNIMSWYSVSHPSNIDRRVQKAIRDRWHFRSKPILVVLDPQGRELSPNAMHMIWIWGSAAFPFTIAKEEALWRDETWRLQLLVSTMDQTILDWVREDKYILLYATDNILWIRNFTNNARAMATAARIPLEMAYVGKSNKRENVRRVIATINEEKLSYCWQDTALIWFFWARLESMLFSKIQLKGVDDQDPIMLQIKKLLSYEKDGSWALLCKGSQILINGQGSTMLQTLAEFHIWKENIPSRGFDLSFKDYYDKRHSTTYSCCRFEFPIAGGRLPEGISCPECKLSMEKYLTFLCCHDQIGHSKP